MLIRLKYTAQWLILLYDEILQLSKVVTSANIGGRGVITQK